LLVASINQPERSRGSNRSAASRRIEQPRRAGHSVDTCERYYARIFDDVDPARRVDPEDAIRAAREPGVSGVQRLFDVAERAGS
jgi:hypothetical protein